MPIATGWGPTRREVARARRAVVAMSLAERAGQVIVARDRGTAAPVRLVRELHLGGVVLFAGNVADNTQVRRTNRVLQDSVRRAGRPFGLTIAVDQEGGQVERVTTATRFPAFMTAGAAGDPRLTRAAPTATSRCRCSAARSRGWRAPTWCPSAPASRPGCPASWWATSTSGRSTRGCRPRSPGRW